MCKYILVNGKIITPFEVFDDYIIEIKDKKIGDIFKKEDLGKIYLKEDYDRVIDLKGKIIAPGFIDIHNHGVNGVDFSNSGLNIEKATKFLAKNGVTSFLLTNGMPPFDHIINNIRDVKKIIDKGYEGARICGFNFELPYLSSKFGAHPELALKPVPDEYNAIIEESMPYVKVMTVAPEIEGARELIRYLNQNNIITSIGHSEASKDDIDFAIFNGAKLITHIFDAFGPPIQTRKGIKQVGIEEYLLTREDLYAEVVADKNGVHVDPLFIKILLDIKGKDKVILITDSIDTAGLKSKEFKSEDGRAFIIEDDININKDNGDVCGSLLTLNKAVKNIIDHTGINLKDALLMASYNPAKLLGIDNKKGSIKVGMDADIIVIDNDINVYMTIIEGDIISNKLILKKEDKQ